MRVLLLGGTGNLGSRLIPALLAHSHVVTAFVRSKSKLQGIISPALFERITIYEGDGLDSEAVEDAIRKNNCDAIMQTSGNIKLPPWGYQVLGKLAESISSAAIRVGKDRGKPLRAWFIGGCNSLEYPGTGGMEINDYMPRRLIRHHIETQVVMSGLSTNDIEWSLLCVAMMVPASEKIELLEGPRGNNLAVGTKAPPEWQDHWVRWIPLIGPYLNLVPAIMSLQTVLEDVADMIAEDFEKGSDSKFIGALVGMKDRSKIKTS